MKKGDLLKFRHDASLIAIIVKGPYATILTNTDGPKKGISEETIVVDAIVNGMFYKKIKVVLLDKIDEQSN